MIKVLIGTGLGFFTGMVYGLFTAVKVPDSAMVKMAIFIKGIVKVMSS